MKSNSSRISLTAHSAGIAIVMMALSVSFTQIFIGIAFLFFLVDRLPKIKQIPGSVRSIRTTGNQEKVKRLSLVRLPPPLLTGALLFSLLILFALIHTFMSHDFSLSNALKAEPGDIFLYLFGVLMYRLSRNPADRPLLQRYILVFAILLVFSGFVAIFSEFRLARIVMGYGFVPSAANRPQHPAFYLGPFRLYRPIGFMDTRLTYGGLLAMVLPWLTLRPLLARDAKAEAKSQTGMDSRREAGKGAGGVSGIRPGMGLFLLDASSIATGWLVIALNGARSSQGGFLASMVLALLVFEKYNKYKHIKRIKFFFHGRKGAAIALATLLVLMAGAALFQVRWGYLLDRAEVRLFRHTDHQRMIIWASTEGLIKSHPLLGIGAGTYQKEALEWRNNFVRKYPTTWYFVQNAPSGHAHNDLLHLTAIGGIPAGLLFLFLMFATLREALRGNETEMETENRTELTESALLLAGTLAFFLGGLFQCYYQDDEVVVFYWTLIGFALGWRREVLNRRHPGELP